MKKLLELLATHGGVIVCSSSLSREQIAIANACGRMYVDEDGIGFVYMKQYAQSHANQDGWVSCLNKSEKSAMEWLLIRGMEITKSNRKHEIFDKLLQQLEAVQYPPQP